LSTAKFNFAIFFNFVVDFSFALYPGQRYLQVKYACSRTLILTLGDFFLKIFLICVIIEKKNSRGFPMFLKNLEFNKHSDSIHLHFEVYPTSDTSWDYWIDLQPPDSDTSDVFIFDFPLLISNMVEAAVFDFEKFKNRSLNIKEQATLVKFVLALQCLTIY